MDLKFLGRGSAFNTKEGNTAAYCIKDDMLLLIDCGESVFQKIKEKDLLNGIKEVNILITHLHSDHAGSLSSLILYCYYSKKIIPNIYYPDMINLKIFLECTGAIKNKTWKELNVNNLYLNYDITILHEVTKHCDEINAFRYQISDNLDNIYYSGDTTGDTIGDLSVKDIEYYSKIYHDVCLADYEGNVHTSLKKLSEMIPEKFRYKIWCMHFDCDETIKKAKKLGFNVVEIER